MAAQSLPSLLSRVSLDDHDDVLKAANGALKRSKGDLEAQHVKVVALIKLDRFEDALRVIDDGGDRLKERARLAHAYALYKAGHLQEAVTIAGSKIGNRGLEHVEAQATYRAENFARTAELYQQLTRDIAKFSNEENDLRINSAATDAQLEWAGNGHLAVKQKPGREELEAFETAFNAACRSIGKGELGRGEVLLRRAKELCSASEELTDEEKAAELLPILIQRVYVLCRQGRGEEAYTLCSSIDVNGIPDLSTRHIAQTNALGASMQPSNPFLSNRVLTTTPTTLKGHQMFQFQSQVLCRNQLAIDLQCLKYSAVERSTSAYLMKHSLPSIDPDVTFQGVCNAAAHAQNRTSTTALKHMLAVLEKKPDDVGLVLTILQLHLLSGNHGSAITILETFLTRLEMSGSLRHQELRFAPGIVSILVSLYSLQGRGAQVRTELSKAASYWRHKERREDSNFVMPTSLFKAAGTALLRSPRAEDWNLAGEVFSQLCSENPNDHFSIAGLVAAKSIIAPLSITKEYMDALTPTAELVGHIDAIALEETGVARPVAVTIAPLAGAKRKAEEQAHSKKARKIPRRKMPKDFDPDRKMDPERWRPLRDRSTYRPKGRKGKQKAADRMQGGFVQDESRPTTPANSGVVTAGAGGAVAKAKKKKAKGSAKW